MARRYFGTDGVRGVVGQDLTVDLVERLGYAAALWSGRGRVFVGRDTRASGIELEEAFARGIAIAGGNAVLAGVLPTPAVALLSLDLGAVISASHNPPEYNGVKLFDGEGQKLSDESEEEIEALLDELRGQILAEDPPDAIRTEISASHYGVRGFPACRSRCAAGEDSMKIRTRRAACRERCEGSAEPGSARREPIPAGEARTSAWRTAGPCGPCAVRPSCARRFVRRASGSLRA